MTIIGNHMRITVHPNLREKTQQFYQAILNCEKLDSPAQDLDIFRFKNDVMVGLYYSSDCLDAKDFLKAAWLELKTHDVNQLKKAILCAGIHELEYNDKSHFYFQDPGGQIFRGAEE